MHVLWDVEKGQGYQGVDWEWFASWTTSTVEEVHVYWDAESPPRNRGARVRGTRREMESEPAVELDRQVRNLQEQIADVKRKTAEARREKQRGRR
jgi:hypothetical protein